MRVQWGILRCEGRLTLGAGIGSLSSTCQSTIQCNVEMVQNQTLPSSLLASALPWQRPAPGPRQRTQTEICQHSTSTPASQFRSLASPTWTSNLLAASGAAQKMPEQRRMKMKLLQVQSIFLPLQAMEHQFSIVNRQNLQLGARFVKRGSGPSCWACL